MKTLAAQNVESARFLAPFSMRGALLKAQIQKRFTR
jgi:hypothetical protein